MLRIVPSGLALKVTRFRLILITYEIAPIGLALIDLVLVSVQTLIADRAHGLALIDYELVSWLTLIAVRLCSGLDIDSKVKLNITWIDICSRAANGV